MTVSIEQTIRKIVREEIRAALQDLKPMNTTVQPVPRPAQQAAVTLEDLPPVMSPKTLSQAIEVSVATLSRWRRDGIGPEPIEPNRTNMIRYAKTDVIHWLEQNKNPTE